MTAQTVATKAEPLNYLTPDPARVRDVGTEADWPAGLAEQHRAYLRDRAVGPKVAAARGTYTATTSKDLPAMPTGKWSQAVKVTLNRPGNAALVFPLHTASGECTIAQMRLDTPRAPSRDSKKPPKFETPAAITTADGSLYPDVHPLAAGNPADAPLVITEGPGKADAIMTAAMREGLVVTPVLLTGVNAGYRSQRTEKDPDAEPILAPAMASLAAPGRLAILAFDADRSVNERVAGALRATGKLLEAAGCVVLVADVPAVDGDQKSGIDDFLSAARRAGHPSPLATMLQAAQPLSTAIPDRRLTVVKTPTTLPDVIREFNGTRVQLSTDAIAVIGGKDHGLYYATTDFDPATGQTVQSVEQVIDWLAWRSTKTSTLVADDEGNATSPYEARYDVELIRRDGRRFTVRDLSPADSLNPKRIVELADAAVNLPTGGTHLLARASNMLAVLGQDEAGRQSLEALSATGWIIDPVLGPVYAAPAGSVTASGITTAWSVGSPVGSEDGALKPAQRLTGWDHAAEGQELKDAARAFRGLIAIAPKRPEVGIALLGLQAAAALALPRRSPLVLVGLPGCGKSMIASASQAFVSSVGLNGSDFSFSFGEGSTRTGAELTLAWSRHGVAYCDDYRVGDDPQRDHRSREALAAIVQGVYSGAGKTQGSQTGGLRAQTSIRACAVITAEEEPSTTAITERSVIVTLQRGDIPLDGNAPIDAFRDNFAKTGLARAGWASYLQYLAKTIGEHENGLRGFSSEADEVRRRYAASRRDERAGETVAMIATGWHYLHKWAAENGIENLLPSRSEVTNALDALVAANRVVHRDAALHVTIINRIRELLESTDLFLTDAAGGRPASPARCGWKRVDDGFGAQEWRAPGKPAGAISADGLSVVITPTAVRLALKAAGIGVSDKQVDRTLAQAGYSGGRDQRCPLPFSIAGRPRGWVAPAEKLGVGVDPDLQPVVAAKEEVIY